MRGAAYERWPAERRTDVVEVAGYPVRVKISPGRVKVEHDDAAHVAGRAGLPLREVSPWPRRPGAASLHAVPDPAEGGGSEPEPA